MFDFSTINPDEIGDGASIDLPTGIYKGSIASCKATQSKNTGRAQHEFKVSITEDPYKGAIRTEWISDPTGPEDKVKFIWIRVFQSIGVTPEKLKAAGTVPPEQIPAFFTGKPCFIDFVKGNRDMGQYDKLRFITAKAYEVKKAQAVALAASGTTQVAQEAPVVANVLVTPPVAAPVAAPANAAGASNDLLAMLNG